MWPKYARTEEWKVAFSTESFFCERTPPKYGRYLATYRQGGRGDGERNVFSNRWGGCQLPVLLQLPFWVQILITYKGNIWVWGPNICDGNKRYYFQQDLYQKHKTRGDG
jgi:hypothetical protein